MDNGSVVEVNDSTIARHNTGILSKTSTQVSMSRYIYSTSIALYLCCTYELTRHEDGLFILMKRATPKQIWSSSEVNGPQ